MAWQYAGGGAHPWGNTDLGIYDEAFVSPGGAPPPAPLEDDDMLMYQQNNGTISLLSGGRLINLGSGADVTYLETLGVKLAYEKNLTPAAAANILAASVVAPPGGGGLTTAQDATLTGAAAGVTRLVAELHTP
jgi:hypothetical protein